MRQELLRQRSLNQTISELDGEYLDEEQLDPELVKELRVLGYLN